MAADGPIIVLGCPRSGTRLAARVLGQPEGHFLVTEHADKSGLPEEGSGVRDCALWWGRFRFLGAECRGRPWVEVSRWDPAAAQALAADYRRLAGGRRLVIKNPQSLLRVGQLRTLFPDAAFVFCLRDPREALNSKIEGSRRRAGKRLWQRLKRRFGRSKPKLPHVHLLKSPAQALLPDDLFLRTAWSWAEACEVHAREQGAGWHLLRYEDLIARPVETVAALYTALGVDDSAAATRAAALPRPPDPEREPAALLAAIEASPYREEALHRLREGLRFCPFPAAERWLAQAVSGRCQQGAAMAAQIAALGSELPSTGTRPGDLLAGLDRRAGFAGASSPASTCGRSATIRPATSLEGRSAK